MNFDDERQHWLRHLEQHKKHMEEQLARHAEQLQRQRARAEEQFERAKRRIMGDADDLSADQKRIIEAALALLNEVGLNDLSLRRLAEALDLRAPALYWHFKNKESLIDHMAEAILREEFHDLKPRGADENWDDWLVTVCKRLGASMRRYRDGARVVAGAHMFPAVTLLRLFETCLVSLVNAGIEFERANLIVMTTVHFVFGHIIEEQSSPRPGPNEYGVFEGLLKDYPLVAKSVSLSMQAGPGGRDRLEEALRLIVGKAH